MTRLDLKSAISCRRQPRDLAREHYCRCGSLGFQPTLEAVHLFSLAFDFHDQPSSRVQHEPSQAHLIGQPIDKRPESHTLHHAIEADAKPLNARLFRDPYRDGFHGLDHFRRQFAPDTEAPSFYAVYPKSNGHAV